MSTNLTANTTIATTNSASNLNTLISMSDKELKQTVENLRKSNRVIELENLIFENYLKKHDPKLLPGKTSQNYKYKGSTGSTSRNKSLSSVTNRSLVSFSQSRASKVSISTVECGRRINIRTKLEMCAKETEQTFKYMEAIRKKFSLKKRNLDAEMEEIGLRINETKQNKQYLHDLIKKEQDPITHLLPKEKFIRYLEEWLKSANYMLEKLRLHIVSLRYKYKNLIEQMKQKEELGESLHLVDMTQLKIDNQVLTKKIEQKNKELTELKNRTGEVCLCLSTQKSYLQSLIKELNKINTKIKGKQQNILELNKEILVVEKEVEFSGEKLKQTERLIDNYTVPDVLEYIIHKYEVHELAKTIKIWQRRIHIQKKTLDTSIRKMKKLTKSKHKNPAWFVKKSKKDESSSNEESDAEHLQESRDDFLIHIKSNLKNNDSFL